MIFAIRKKRAVQGLMNVCFSNSLTVFSLLQQRSGVRPSFSLIINFPTRIGGQAAKKLVARKENTQSIKVISFATFTQSKRNLARDEQWFLTAGGHITDLEQIMNNQESPCR